MKRIELRLKQRRDFRDSSESTARGRWNRRGELQSSIYFSVAATLNKGEGFEDPEDSCGRMLYPKIRLTICGTAQTEAIRDIFAYMEGFLQSPLGHRIN